MGNRLIIICYSKDSKEVSPTIYQHWSQGKGAIATLLREQFETFKGRKDDCSYFTARLIGRLHGGDDKESCSLGVWNTPKDIEASILSDNWKALKDYSHGDEGIILVDVVNFKFDVLDYDYFSNN